jgi:MFS family permease
LIPDVAIRLTNARRWSVVGLLFTASLINYFDRATISFALPLISKELVLGPEAKGVLLSAFFWSYTLMQIPMGVLADRVNLRWLYAGAFTLWSLAQGLMGFASGLTSLIALRVLLGIGEAIYLPGGSKIVSLLFPPAQRALPNGLFDAGTRTGLVTEGILVPWMLVHYGWRASFSLVGFAALIWLIPWFLATPFALRVPPSARGPASSISFGQRVLLLVTNRNLLGICLGFFCFDYYWYFLVNWLPDYRHVTGLTILGTSMRSLFRFRCEQPIGGWIADRLVHRGWSESRLARGVTGAFLAVCF